MTRGMFYVAAIGALTGGLATPASAQFDPLHNNLKCYKITGGALTVNLQLDNQFGRERVAHLVPQFLCAPTHKDCCDAAGVCSATACNPEPSTNQPAAVDHFKCYKIKVKECTPITGTTNFDCTKLTGHFPPAGGAVSVTLNDQFHTEDVTVGKPKMLCVPVQKIGGATTTTTTSTTTTTQGCGGPTGQPPTCGGGCATGTCVFVSGSCTCGQPCTGTGTCGGFCPGTLQVCVAASATAPCQCCLPPGAPCATGTDCCTGVCSTGTCGS